MKIRPHRKTRCVYIDYAGDFHLDLVPCITLDEECYICNNKENRFEDADGTVIEIGSTRKRELPAGI